MLQLPAIKQYDDWATLYSDSDNEAMFYAIPNIPRLRWIDDNTPAFTFLKFSEPVRSGGNDPNQDNLGGGYVQFDCELSLTPDQTKVIATDMQSVLDKSRRARGLSTIPVNIAPPTWHDSNKVGVTLITFPAKPDGSGFINNIAASAKPSLLGSNIATFAAELSQHGATLLWNAFQMAVMPVSVVYRLEVMAQIPTVSMHVWLHAGQVHQFTEQINKDIDSSVWGDTDQQYTDNMQEIFSKYAVGGVDVTGFDPGSGDSSDDFAKIKKDMEEQGWAMMEQTLQDDMKDKFLATPASNRGAEGDYKNTVRDYLEAFSQDLDVYFKDKDVIPWPMNPQGSLQGILTQPHKGRIPNKSDFFKEISLDDDFFKLLQLRIHCICDFEKDPIDSVVVHVVYGSNVADFRLTATQPDTTFRAYIDKSLGKNWTYSYVVYYKGTDRSLKSEPLLKGSGDALTISVADMGYLKLQVTAIKFNWSVIDSAQVRIKYSDAANGIPEQEDVIPLGPTSASQQYSRMIYSPVTQPYYYAVDFYLKNEQRTTVEYQPSRATSLNVNDIFGGLLAVTVLPAGNLDQISHIVVDLDYEDPAHQYSQQTTYQFSRIDDKQLWLVPTWPGGPNSYRYRTLVAYKDGHSTQSDWTPQTGSGSLTVGEVFSATLNVTFRADLIDWTKVRLVLVKIQYTDPGNSIAEEDELIFNSAKPLPQTWSTPIKDATKRAFQYSVTFYNTDSTQASIPVTTTSDPMILLDNTAAVAAGGPR